MKTLAQACAQASGDVLVADVVGNGVFLDITCKGASKDVKLSPEKARELAEWLNDAALEAEAYDDEA